MPKNISIGLKNKNWIIELNYNGFKLLEKNISEKEDKTFFQAAHKKTNINLTIYLEQGKKKNGTIEDCRNFYWSRELKSPYEKKDVLMKEIDDMAIVEYFIPVYKAIEINQKNINAYLVYEDIWIDIHISKNSFDKNDLQNLYDVLKSIEIKKTETPPILKTYFNALEKFNKGLYHEAIDIYLEFIQTELNKEKTTLPKYYLLNAIENAGISYKKAGELKNALEMFELGLSINPKYPMFYYNLARVYADLDDFKRTLKYLKSCLNYIGNLNAGKMIPDPKTESDFQNFFKNKQFIDLVNEFIVINKTESNL